MRRDIGRKKHSFSNFAIIIILGIILCLNASDPGHEMKVFAQGVEKTKTPPARGWGVTKKGVATILVGDGEPGGKGTVKTRLFLSEKPGQAIPLSIAENISLPRGGIWALDRTRLKVTGEIHQSGQVGNDTDILVVNSLSQEQGGSGGSGDTLEAAAVNGSHPFVSILCKFSDISEEPQNLSYFQGMYSESYPGLGHYWKEQSYGSANIQGSNAYGWYTLPAPRSYYVYDKDSEDPGDELDFERITDDCIGVADGDVDFSQYSGINLMFNDDLDGSAWGGGRYLTLDGVTQVWPMTWESPWGYESLTVMAHEMGHAFGLPHSSTAMGYEYGNIWDVMGDNWEYCSLSTDPTYGCLGQHTVAYHKDKLGWIPGSQKYIADTGIVPGITLERLALPKTDNYKYIKIPINDSSSHYYTLEVRRQVGYDVKLPGYAVIIHEVDTNRTDPAYVVDIDENGDTGDSGARWVVGQTFTDEENNISVSVLSESSTGFDVSIDPGNEVGTVQEMEVSGKSQVIQDEDVSPALEDGTAYGDAFLGESATHTFSIQNMGDLDLHLTGSPHVEITGPQAGDFSVIQQPDSPITSSASSTFEIEFKPREEGIREVTVEISNDDIDENPYTFLIQGRGIPTTFNDVHYDYWAYDNIEALYQSGITAGCGDGNYCPKQLVTRAQMALFLEKGIHGSSFTPSDVSSPSFGDTAGHWAEDWIEALYSDGVTAGCGNNNYCPDSGTTRAQIALFLLKSKYGAGYTPPPDVEPTFGDIAGHWAEDWIEQLAAEGITAGCGNGSYCPEESVTRDQMAIFLTRTFDLPIP